MPHSKLYSGTTRALQAARMIARFSKTLYIIFLRGNVWPFFVTVVLNFLGRVFNLAAFVISIQSIYIAFQSSASHGAAFKGKEYFDFLGLSDAWLPWLLAALVVGIFMMPGILKIFETRIIARIARRNHEFCLEQEVFLKTDLFVTTRAPALLLFLCRFFSGASFIIIALAIVALFRVDLFVIVLIISIAIAILVVFSNSRQIIRDAEQIPQQSAYITAARRAFDTERSAEIEEITISASTARETHFNTTLGNWSRVNRTAIYQVGLMGVATAAIVLFVFRLDDLDESKLFMLLYLVIAIRYAISTARETGLMASKVLDLRTENATLQELLAARQKAHE